MRQSFIHARVPLMALSVVLLVTACGGGGGDGAATAPQTGAPVTPGASNHAPTITGNAVSAAHVGEAYSFKPTASDSDGDTLTFSVTGKPTWMSFNSSTGELKGTPTSAGSFNGIVVSVSDGTANASLTAFAVSVSPATSTGAATLNWGAPTQNTDGSALTDLSGYRLIYGRSAENLDNSISVTNPSINSYVVENLSSGTWYFAVVSVSTQGAESARSTIVTATI